MHELPFGVSSVQHRVLGKQVRLQFAENYVLKLTMAEASSLSFALIAVRDGVSSEREIYMSPIASDAAFIGKVSDTGISISLPEGELRLDWAGVGHLAESLANSID